MTAARTKHLFASCTKQFTRNKYTNLNRVCGPSRAHLFTCITE